MVDDRNKDLQLIIKNVNDKEKEINETEKCFEKIPINYKNYLPNYIKNLQKEEKDKINEVISNKIITFNLAVTRKNTIKTEMKDINLKSESSNKKKELKPIKIKGNIFNLKKLNNQKIKKESRNSPTEIKLTKKKLLNPILKKKNLLNVTEDNNIDSIINIRRNNLSKDFCDKRFLGCRNEFEEKYNELSEPFKKILNSYGNNSSISSQIMKNCIRNNYSKIDLENNLFGD